MKTNTSSLIKNFACISAVVLMFGLGVASAQTTNIPGSLSIGPENTATNNSLAVGTWTWAGSTNSVAIGSRIGASGSNSLSVGYIFGAEGDNSVALNQGETYSPYGFAANYAMVSKSYWGGAPTANYAAAFNTAGACADYAFAANGGGANNTFSAAFGLCTQTASPAQFVVGMYNNVVGTNEDYTATNDFDDSSWSQTDALFIVGNGNAGTPSNAMQVRMDGMVLINPSGELGMGSYTNGPTP
jgi:hypothetical protein